MLFNNTSRILRYTDVNSNNGVVLPHSHHVLFESDIDSRIKKTKGHIDHLFNAQSHRNAPGGKRVRARKISLQNQIQYASERLSLLVSAKAIIIKLNEQQLDGLNKPIEKASGCSVS